MKRKVSNKSKKSCLVTGANSGIGYVISEEIIKLNHKLIMVCRNQAKGQNAKDVLLKKYKHADIDLMIADLSNLEDTKNLGKDLIQKYSIIDVVFHNAGIWPTRKELTDDGYELSFVVNHLSIFQLTYDVMSLMHKSNDPRIVLVSAGLIINASFDIDKTPYGDDFGRLKTYANTKLAAVYFMHQFIKLSSNSHIKFNALHPGVYRTNLGNSKGILGWVIKFAKLFMGSPKKSARGSIYLGFSPEVTFTGRFYDVLDPYELPDHAKDDFIASELWKLSEEILGLDWK